MVILLIHLDKKGSNHCTRKITLPANADFTKVSKKDYQHMVHFLSRTLPLISIFRRLLIATTPVTVMLFITAQ